MPLRSSSVATHLAQLAPFDAAGLASLQRTVGNAAVAELVGLQRAPTSAVAQTSPSVAAPTVQRFLGLSQLFGAAALVRLQKAGRTREVTAVNNLTAYAALHGDKGPDGTDKGFDGRLRKAAAELAQQMVTAPSFAKMPARLKAIVYSAEKLNLSPLKSGSVAPENQQWMKTGGGAAGARNPKVAGSTGAFGETRWKCNKLVADAYLAKSGGAIGKSKYPFYGSDRQWGYQANDLAATVHRGKPQLKSGGQLKHFPYSELAHLSADGTAVVEIDEFDAKGRHVARYILNGGVFEKHVPDGKGGFAKTKETKRPEELEPGKMAQLGDLVSFHSAEEGESGHTGLNLGHDLFISAMNATEGIGVLSIKRHIDPSAWDRYDFVGFRRFSG
ncbi:MAG: hypothetical protein KY469_18135 [Actinobacteria bacterium]|nr:hypothetical protein [Actinomycetota bacterium]